MPLLKNKSIRVFANVKTCFSLLCVTNISYFNTNQAWQCARTLEVLGITAVNSSTSNITVTRSLGTTAAAAIHRRVFACGRRLVARR